MKTKTVVLLVSLLANLAFAGVFLMRTASNSAAAPDVARPGAQATLSETKGAAASADQSASAQALWTKVYSKDHSTLLANLKAMGFPPKMIRAIIAAAVQESFAERRKALFAEDADLPYWKAKNASNFSLSSKMQALQREQTQALKALLGSEYTSAIEEYAPFFRRTYGNVSAEKIEMLQMMSSDYNELRSQIMSESNGIMLPEDREKLAMLEKERRAELTALLTPEELAEYDMRSSMTAGRMRSQLTAFDFSEQEFKSVFEILRQVDEKYNTNTPGTYNDSKLMAERRAAEQQAQASIRQTLGEERYAEYQRASNGYFRTANQIADRLQLPKENAVAVYDLSRSSEQQARAIISNKELSQDAKNQSLQGMAREMDAKLNQYLTPKGAEAFKQSTGGAWQRYLNLPTTRPVGSPGN